MFHPSCRPSFEAGQRSNRILKSPIVTEDTSTHYLGKPMIRTLVSFLLLSTLPLAAQARQYGTRGGQVVHTRRAPVVMHRALPPFKGQHVYEGRIDK